MEDGAARLLAAWTTASGKQRPAGEEDIGALQRHKVKETRCTAAIDASLLGVAWHPATWALCFGMPDLTNGGIR